MKKASIIILVVSSMLCVIVWCAHISRDRAMIRAAHMTDSAKALTEAIEDNRTISSTKAQLVEADIRHSAKRIGKYVKEAFPARYVVYRFEDSNIVVFYYLGYAYMLAEGNTDRCYEHLCKSDGKFLALSSKYMLFLTNEGKIAVELAEIKNPIEGNLSEIIHKEITFEDLSVSEQESFVYPSSVEMVEKTHTGLIIGSSIAIAIAWGIVLSDFVYACGIKLILRIKARKANK